MSKKLVIVESPTKAKTISKFLGTDYTIESSFGHVRDLPKSKLGVDIENNFEPQYVIPTRAKKKVTELKKRAKDASMVYFATDEDREGEAISWHLLELFGIPQEKTKRIVFHEITKDAILEALDHPRDIDKHLVDAQQARRVLDRLVGYNLSPLLWKKVARGLSAGRVQSVAVRLIVEREREIKAFTADEFWTIDAIFNESNKEFEAKLFSINNKTLGKLEIKNKQEADDILKNLEKCTFSVTDIEKKRTRKNPLPPFTTSTLQQTANNRLSFSAKQTMMIAQQLYEGIEIGQQGSVGLITYMRTDSINLAERFLQEAGSFIKKTYGDNYTNGPRRFAGKSKLAQEAHEAIRPTDVTNHPDEIKEYLSLQQYRLYKLIWQRAVASQMAAAEIDSTRADIQANDTPYLFRANGSVIAFDGFTKIYPTAAKENILPELKNKQLVNLVSVKGNQHFTQPPARYSEATLVKVLEENGIGRPSTYAPTIATIQERGYVIKEEKKLKPTDLAFLVNDLLVEHFPNIVDYEFTAKMEDELDSVATGEKKWQPVIKNFWGPFSVRLEDKEKNLTKQEVMSQRELGTDPKTGKPVSVRFGRFGPFVQLGTKDDEEKPKFASLPKGKNIDEITLEEALYLLQLPRNLGDDDNGNTIEVNIGRFGPYIKINKKYISLKDYDPYTVTREQCLELITEDETKEEKKNIAEFASGIKILNGRYGPYITDGTMNAKIPKDTEPQSITEEQAKEILEKTGKKKGAGRRFQKRKAAKE